MSTVQAIPNLTPVPVTASIQPPGKDRKRGWEEQPGKDFEESGEESAPRSPETGVTATGPGDTPQDVQDPEERGHIIDVKA